MHLLTETAVFLAAAVVTVPLFRRLRLGAVLGFLAAGLLIGPWGLRLVTDVENILGFAELGVVLLLFVIGLELQPSRLWTLRRPVVGLGGAQVVATTVLLGGIAWAFHLPWQAALVAGFALAMNSTAFVLQLLGERKQLATKHGRAAFAIALFQDISVIPALALVPLLVTHEAAAATNPWLAAGKAVLVIAAVIAGGRFLLRPVLKVVATSGIQEVFTAAALLVVIGTALLMEVAGLSMTLGAFLAGVLLADSEYRHEIEASIEPFKGLLLGLFFIAVGMSANLGLLAREPLAVLGAAIGLMVVKGIVIAAIGSGAKLGRDSTRSLAVLMAHAGEFAFVLFGVASTGGLITGPQNDFLVIVVTLSMALTPLVFLLNENVITPWLRHGTAPQFDTIDDEATPVIVAGIGRVGQIVSRVLNARRIAYTALDIDAEQVDVVRRFGRKAWFGDASKLDLLRAAKADEARILVLAIDDVEASVRVAELVRKHFPHITIVARARNRIHAHQLTEHGVKLITRETFASSLEIAEQVLRSLGFGVDDAHDTVARFRRHDESMLARQFAVHRDEDRLIQTSKEAAAELESLFDSDRSNTSDDESATPVDLARSWR